MKNILKLLILLTLGVFVYTKFDSEHLAPIGQFLHVAQTPENADAIVVLLGGDGPDRVLQAARLFQDGYAPLIVFGTGYQNKDELSKAPPGFVWPPSGERYSAAFMSLKIPENVIRLVDTSDGVDTDGELREIVKFARTSAWKRVLLVTSAFHSRRVHLIWGRIAPDIPAVTIGAPTSDLPRWWENVRSVRAVGYEYGALVKEGVRRIAR